MYPCSLAADSPSKYQILPSTGCSPQLLDLLYDIIDAVLDRHDPRRRSPAHLRRLRGLESRLDSLVQLPRVAWAHAADEEEYQQQQHNAAREQQIAELYRLASRIYLARVARGAARGDAAVVALVDRALAVLRAARPCGRPWPLFVVALEARTEDERGIVRDALAASMARMPPGNLQLVRSMVHAAWVRLDLAGDGAEMMEVYNVVVSGMRVPPSFT